MEQGLHGWVLEKWGVMKSESDKKLPSGSGGKESACNTKRVTPVQSLGQEDPLEKEMATYSSILA